MAEFDINELYQRRFGFVAPPFPQGGIPDPKNLIPFKKLSGLFNRDSMLGAELRMPMALTIPGREKYQFPNEPIISLRGANDVAITTLNRGGKRGNVKELINLEDYKINIRGLIYNQEANDYPEQIVSSIREILEHPGSLQMDCLFTRLFNISLVTVLDFSFPREEETAFRIQEYEINLISDEDFELELI